jgi:hypothetical protein
MQIDHDWHPSELWRHLQLFYKDLTTDFDLRYPEARLRRSYEFQFLPQKGELAELIEEFSLSTGRVISLLDWPLLFEWNERWQQAELCAEISKNLETASQATSSAQDLSSTALKSKRLPEAEEVIRKCLEQIQSECRMVKLSEHPDLFELIRFRWKFAALRDEASYLLKKLRVKKA